MDSPDFLRRHIDLALAQWLSVNYKPKVSAFCCATRKRYLSHIVLHQELHKPPDESQPVICRTFRWQMGHLHSKTTATCLSVSGRLWRQRVPEPPSPVSGNRLPWCTTSWLPFESMKENTSVGFGPRLCKVSFSLHSSNDLSCWRNRCRTHSVRQMVLRHYRKNGDGDGGGMCKWAFNVEKQILSLSSKPLDFNRNNRNWFTFPSCDVSSSISLAWATVLFFFSLSSSLATELAREPLSDLKKV